MPVQLGDTRNLFSEIIDMPDESSILGLMGTHNK